jgi:hypothetical protein
VSDLLMSDSGANEDDPRRRATWGLLALALTAALVVTFMILFLGDSGGDHRGDSLPGTGETVQPSRPAVRTAATSASAAPRPSAAPSTTPRPTPASTGNPCPSAAPCLVPGDGGQAVAAVNKFRTDHGQAAVAGTASPQAQQCAVNEGDGPACMPSYSWEPVATQNGAQVVAKIAGFGEGTQWLLDPAMSAFTVGWAYAPGAGGGPGQYECAILKVG